MLIPDLWRNEILAEREIPNLGLCVIQRFAFTAGLLTNVSFDGLSYDYHARYCYPATHEALRALVSWDGTGDPPGEWVKEKLSGRANPNYELSKHALSANRG